MKGQTKSAILDAARTLFTERGIETVSTRDIATTVGISLGNLTYYFPSKNDIVLSLGLEFIAEVDKALLSATTETSKKIDVLTEYYTQIEAVFGAQLRYRFLLNKSYANIVTAIPEIQRYYQQALPGRFTLLKEMHTRLVHEKLATPALIEDTTELVYVLNILALFWHQETEIYFPALPQTKKARHAIALFFQPYKPYLTKKGREIFATLIKPLSSYHPGTI